MSIVVGARSRAGVPISVIFLEVLPAALAVLLLAVVGTVHVTSRVMVVRLGYQLSQLDSEATELTRENDSLKLELATLNSPTRLESLAKAKLGLVAPSAGSVVHLKQK